MLEVRLIGKLAISCDGNPVTLSSRAAQSLFAYLILTAGTFHRREKLAGVFWPDATEEKARAYLRHELWRIRKAFPASDFLVSDDIEVTFDASKEYWLDVAVLEKVSGTASAEELMAALSVYQGELLPGFYDEWVMPEREHLHAMFEQKMGRLLDLLEREQRWSEILEWAERWISLGQGPEAAYRFLMFAYTALGDRAKVAAIYERCVQALAELGLEPSAETRALAKKRAAKINIPIPLTSFIGRQNELKEVASLLSKSRLVTLTGSGGVGKTRLAIQVVADVLDLFPDGVWFLDLAPISDPGHVPNALAEVLGLRLMGGSDLSITDLIIGYLGSRRVLIIFDNCEHLIDSSAQLAHSLLTACESLTLLATSREALRISGEIPYRVPSLEIPKHDIEFILDEISNTESVKLFTERATVISPGFTIGKQNALVIAQICHRLGGIPLAIELAAARVNVLTVDQILKRLDDRFNLLTSGSRTALPRHQTLRATIEWSYDLLSEKERLLFQRLAVFTGGWTLEAAEEVCSGDGIGPRELLDLLSQLVTKSLVLVETPNSNKTRGTSAGFLRYRRLETLRQFAHQKLFESSEAAGLRRKHAIYYANLDSISDDEIDNIRSVYHWSLETGEAKPALRLARDFFFWEKHVLEGLQFISRVLNLPGAQGYTQERGLALYSAAVLAYFHRDYPMARVFLDDLLRVGHVLNDFSMIWDQKFMTAALAMGEGTYEGAYDIFLEMRDQRDSFRYALCTLAMASCVLMLHNLDRSRQHAEEARKRFYLFGTNSYLVESYTVLGYIAVEAGDIPLARIHFRQGIRTAVSNSVQQKSGAIFAGLGGAAFREGNLHEAARWFGMAKMVITTTGYYVRLLPENFSQDDLTRVRSLLDPDTFQAAWEEGYGMTMENAIQYALKEL